MTGWAAEVMARLAAQRLRRDYPEWAEAMASECEALPNDTDRLSWSAGCLAASYRTPRSMAVLGYIGALVLGVCGMGAFQWSQDESLATVAMLSAITALLGAVSPRRFLISGLAVGVVVAGLNSFGAVTGIRPEYETARHSLLHCLRWLALLGPALTAAVVGREVGLKLRT